MTSEDEIERLRAALREIDSAATSHVRGAIGVAQRIARAALNGEPLPDRRGWTEWRAVPGFEEYQVSRDGEVRRQYDRLLQVLPTRWGHMHVTLYDRGGKQFKRGIHRLVAMAFLGPPPPGKPLACHKNGRAWDNKPENLYWGSHAENVADRMRHASLIKRGQSGEFTGRAP